MNSGKNVCIIGGGVAGLSSAVFLAKEGFKIKLFEASPKLGGRAYSFFDREKDQFFDNGQHILAGWYKATFEYLKIIGSFPKMTFQKSLEINFIEKGKDTLKLKFPDLLPPFDLYRGLSEFKAFDKQDRKALRKFILKLLSGRFEKNKFSNAAEILNEFQQTENLRKYFWNPFILAVFNTVPEKIDPEIFFKILKMGFIKPGNSRLVIPAVNLNELLVDGVKKYLSSKNAEINIATKVEKIIIKDESVEEILLDSNEKVKADFFISAVPFFKFNEIFAEEDLKRFFTNVQLKSSSIVSVHLFFKNEIGNKILPESSYGMTGMIGTNVQWIFKRSDKHLCLVISGADHIGIKEMSNEKIVDLAMKELNYVITGFEKLTLDSAKVIKEKRATFVPDKESRKYRLNQNTKIKNFFIAGDWTETGLPSTIESAVRSSKIISKNLKVISK